MVRRAWRVASGVLALALAIPFAGLGSTPPETARAKDLTGRGDALALAVGDADAAVAPDHRIQARQEALGSFNSQIVAINADIANEQLREEVDATLRARLEQETQRITVGVPDSVPVLKMPHLADVMGNDYVLPVAADDYYISAVFGQRGLWANNHRGVDFAATYGTPVYAVTAGVVGYPPALSTGGNEVVLYHADGSASNYAHLQRVDVKPGDLVSAGDQIGTVGSTGRSSGPHLHLGYFPPGTVAPYTPHATDPMAWLKAHGLKP